MSEERLQKILARAGIASRRKAEELIREGLVTINGRVAELGEKADPEHDAIKVDGKRIHPSTGHRYLLLNKPKGFMSTLSDPEGRPTVVDFVPPGMRKALMPVGRLDFNTEGLLLLTDDGELAQRIAHPSSGCTKTYEVKVKGRPTDADIDRLQSGVVLDGRRTAPCRIVPRGSGVAKRRGPRTDEDDGENTWWIVELGEGRNRQIREMFYRIGHGVQKLRRVAIGPLRDPHLPLGGLRELTEQEVEKLNRAATRPKKLVPAKRAPKKAPKGEETGAPKRAARKPAGKESRTSRPAKSVARKPTSRSGRSGAPKSRSGAPKRAGGGPRRGTRGRG
ncbi:MAG TPA: pseudouridine synthase [Thermoanaerobaculia bacterium]|nr:pseudouridine synthase [Thermoanaerobaculia bacterium]